MGTETLGILLGDSSQIDFFSALLLARSIEGHMEHREKTTKNIEFCGDCLLTFLQHMCHIFVTHTNPIVSLS
jgi:hypothetical protein